MRFRPLIVLLLLAPAALAAQNRVVPLDTVQVAATSRAAAEMAAATRGVEVITARQIGALPARAVVDVLAWALAVDVMPRSPALADVAVRGGTFDQVLVMVDGVRASERDARVLALGVEEQRLNAWSTCWCCPSEKATRGSAHRT